MNLNSVSFTVVRAFVKCLCLASSMRAVVAGSWTNAKTALLSSGLLIIGGLLAVQAEAEVSLTATPASVQPGSPITVTWSVTAGQVSAFDWVGLFKTGDPNTSYDESRWIYTNGNMTGSIAWNAPATPGTYEARYLLDNGFT